MRTWALGDFGTPRALLEGVRALQREGFHRLDMYTPYPVDGASEALRLPPTRIPWFALLGGLGGALFGYLTQWFTNAVDYPLNVGGRPLHSVPAFIPATFESGVLGAAACIFFGLLALFGFPRLHHPTFEVERFARTQSDGGFWVSVTLDAAEEARRAEARLRALGATHVALVEEEETSS